MQKRRRTIAVSPESVEKLIKMQGIYQEKINKRKSMRDIADEIIKKTSIEEFEKKILGEDTLQGGLGVRYD